MSAVAWDDLTDEQRERLLGLVADPEPEPEPDRPTPEQIAGRPLVDLTVDELQDVAREVELEGRSTMKRDELIVALGGDPEAMTESERVEAAAALAAYEVETAPEVDPNELPPWERHDDVERPMTTEELLAAIAASQGALSEHTVDPETGERRVLTWEEAEAAARGRRLEVFGENGSRSDE